MLLMKCNSQISLNVTGIVVTNNRQNKNHTFTLQYCRHFGHNPAHRQGRSAGQPGLRPYNPAALVSVKRMHTAFHVILTGEKNVFLATFSSRIYFLMDCFEKTRALVYSVRQINC